MARTVDHISDGRMILGIGAGWFQHDYDEYGYEFGTPGSRLSDLRDALPRIENRWAQLSPPPIRDIPILIGGGGERRTLRYAARHADIWHGWGRPDTVRHKCEVLDNWCAREGRDPAEIERSCGANPLKPETGDGYVDAGATLLTLSFDGRESWDLSPLNDWLSWRDQRNRQS
jgi:alkanesulfonate monooxygenase SsuD/methylene tetrahydromethanopterin reductase-like flavin-dependent oxidoreductase (luciferase family)